MTQVLERPTDISPAVRRILDDVNQLSSYDRRILADSLAPWSTQVDEADYETPEVKAAWKAETSRRLDDIRSGRVVGLTAAECDAELWRRQEARRLASQSQ